MDHVIEVQVLLIRMEAIDFSLQARLVHQPAMLLLVFLPSDLMLPLLGHGIGSTTKLDHVLTHYWHHFVGRGIEGE